MKTYLIKRLQQTIKFILLLDILVAAVAVATRNEEIWYFLAVGSLVLVLLVNPSIYLLFPYSRKRLVVFHVFDSLLGIAILLFNFFLVQQLVHLPREGAPGLEPVVLMTLIFGFIRLILPVRLALKSSNLSVGTAKAQTKAYVILVFVTAIVYRLREQSWFHVVMATAIAVFLPLLPLTVLIMPTNSMRRWIKNFQIGYVLVLLLIFACGVGIAQKGEPESQLTATAVGVLGKIPVPYSSERLSELILSDSSSSYVRSLVNQDFIDKFDEGTWKNRTLKCATGRCLDGSEFLIPKSLSRENKIDRFAEILKACKPGLTKDGRARCQGATLKANSLNTWLALLSDSEILSWLKHSDDYLAFAAIRAMYKRTVTPEIKIQLEEMALKGSDPIRVAADAQLHIYNSCGQDKKEVPGKDVCQFTPGDLF